jgi:hypothetical protein
VVPRTRPADFDEIPDGAPLAEVAWSYGVTIREVRRWLASPLARGPRGRYASRLDKEEIVSRYRAGESLAQVADAIGASRPGVLYHLKAAGVSRRPPGASAREQHRS